MSWYEINTLLDSADIDTVALRSAMDRALATETQVKGLSWHHAEALRRGQYALMEDEAEETRRAERRAAGVPMDLPEMPRELRCPITMEPFRNPVVAADGHTYERRALERHLSNSTRSPMTNAEMGHSNIMFSLTIRTLAREWRAREHAHIMHTAARLRDRNPGGDGGAGEDGSGSGGGSNDGDGGGDGGGGGHSGGSNNAGGGGSDGGSDSGAHSRSGGSRGESGRSGGDDDANRGSTDQSSSVEV